MLKFIGKRMLTILFVLWAVSTLTYFAVHITPGDMARAIVVQVYGEEFVNEEVLQAVRNRFDLDRPVVAQYWDWLVNIFRFNFGTSYQYNMPVISLLKIRVPNTLKMGGLAFLISSAISIPLGILCAIRQNKLLDHLTRLFTLAAGSFPGFWVAIMLIIVFALKLHLLPTSGADVPEGIILPALTLAISMTASTTRMTRTCVLDVLRQDYMVTADSKGITRRRIISAHALRNAIPSVITMLGLQVGHIIGGSVLVENVFAWPGVGNLLNQAISGKDVPMIEGCVIMITFSYAFMNLVVDIVYALLDPRVKYQEGGK